MFFSPFSTTGGLVPVGCSTLNRLRAAEGFRGRNLFWDYWERNPKRGTDNFTRGPGANNPTFDCLPNKKHGFGGIIGSFGGESALFGR